MSSSEKHEKESGYESGKGKKIQVEGEKSSKITDKSKGSSDYDRHGKPENPSNDY